MLSWSRHRRKKSEFPELAAALQRALEMQREKVVNVFLQLPGVTFNTCDMCRLYLLRDHTDFLWENKDLQKNLREYAKLDVQQGEDLTPQRRYLLYQKTLKSVMDSCHDLLGRLLKKGAMETQAHDVFFWLLFQVTVSHGT